jgi:hypothetical protein
VICDDFSKVEVEVEVEAEDEMRTDKKKFGRVDQAPRRISFGRHDWPIMQC